MRRLGMVTPVEDLGLRLIAPTLCKNALFDIKNGSLYSVDMVRIAFNVEGFEGLGDYVDRWAGLYYLDTYTSNRIGSYRHMWVWDKADAQKDGCKDGDGSNGCKLVCGFGLISAKGKFERKGFIEFNPNRVDSKGRELLKYLSCVGCTFELMRYDLAIDYPVSRDSVRMVKDRRKYGCEVSQGMTEYLGQRSHAGRVKVYDKRIQAQLHDDCTRVEVTCSGDWSTDEILRVLPTVFTYANRDYTELKGVTRAFVLAVCGNLEKGDVVEPWLRLVEPRMKTKVRNILKSDSNSLVYNRECIERAIENAHSFVD